MTKQIRFLCAVLTAVSIVLMGAAPSTVSAASYDVTASIPYPAPTTAAIIDPSLDGKDSPVDLFTVFGTCEHLSPASIVSLWRGLQLLGSVNCEPSGTFSLVITLISGANTIIARTSSLSENYGPDSTPVTISYTPPLVVNPGQPTNTPPKTAQPSTDPLFVTSPTPFEILHEDKGVTIKIVVSGGKGPYNISVNWGDGSTETSVVADIGSFSFKHVYEENGIYKVVATVTDVLGESKVYQFIVASTSVPQADSVEQKTDRQVVVADNGVQLLLVWTVILLILLLFLGMLTSFWLGRRYEYNELKDRTIARSRKRLEFFSRKKDKS